MSCKQPGLEGSKGLFQIFMLSSGFQTQARCNGIMWNQECLIGTLAFQSKLLLKDQYFKTEPSNPSFLETSLSKYLSGLHFQTHLHRAARRPARPQGSQRSERAERQPRPRRAAVRPVSSHHPGDACWLSPPTKNLHRAPMLKMVAGEQAWSSVGAAHTTSAWFAVLQQSAAAGAWRSGNQHIVKITLDFYGCSGC